MARQLKISVLFLLSFATACGRGPSKDAVVANTLLTIMANLIEANVTILVDDTIAPQENVPCSGGSGTLRVNDPTFGTIDPGLTDATISSSVDFNNCVIKVCNRKRVTVLNGNDQFSIALNAVRKAGTTNLSDISLTAISRGLTFSGELSGELSFSYSMTGDLSRDTFGGILIREAAPSNPLILNGKTYLAEELFAMADGC
jgi:hypothetical protein